MKTLCISDLDGTLLDRGAELTEYTKSVLNRFMASGGYFSAATARTSETVRHILCGAAPNIPAIILNGAAVYDLRLDKIARAFYINRSGVDILNGVIEKYSLSGFMYNIKDGRICANYTRLETEQSRLFLKERIKKYNKQFIKIDSFRDLDPDSVVYFSVCENFNIIRAAAAVLKESSSLNAIFYKDVYSDNLWYLEACPAEASKRTALDFLRDEYKFERVIAFGDNYNDLPLFAGADYRCAVANAADEVKAAADEIIGDNASDGVVKWIEKNLMDI